MLDKDDSFEEKSNIWLDLGNLKIVQKLFIKLFKNKKALKLLVLRLFWRKVRDSNPGMVAHCRFSRPVPSTPRPTFQLLNIVKPDKLNNVFRFSSFSVTILRIPFSIRNIVCWHRHKFPGRHQPSIVCTGKLNYRVRKGNGWDLAVMDTNYFSIKVSYLEN